MLSHIIILWTNPAVPNATEELIAAATRCLQGIPGIQHFHIGRMAPSQRRFVDQTYQVAINMTFADQQGLEDYHAHPFYADFVRNVYRRYCTKVNVFDFVS